MICLDAVTGEKATTIPLSLFDPEIVIVTVLEKHGIHTTADLQANIEQSKSELSTLEHERSGISNRIRRPKSPEEQAQNKECRKAVSKQMKPVRERLRRAERILEKSPHLYELLKQEHELEKKARARYKERGR